MEACGCVSVGVGAGVWACVFGVCVVCVIFILSVTKCCVQRS